MSTLRYDEAQRRRFEVFNLTQGDIALLQSNAEFARNRLPGLIASWHDRFAAWPELQRALAKEEVHKVRVAHWVRVVSGGLGEGFMESARALAAALYDNGVPGYAVSICHAIVSNGIARELGLEETTRRGLFGNRSDGDKRAVASALVKTTFLDLEVLLETYAEAEKAAKQRSMQQVAEIFESKMRSVVAGVTGSIKQLESAAGSLTSTAQAVAGTSDDAASASRGAGENVSVVAHSAEELRSAIHDINKLAVESRDVASQAVSRAGRTSETISSLEQAVARIGSVADLITEIAGRTNLLALNATIEAARAGEAGKGFAVVAQEVKTLANQTAQATDEISGQIRDMQEATSSAVSAIGEISRTITQISAATTSIGAAIEQQSASTEEISRSAASAAGSNRDAMRLVEDVKHSAENTRTVAGEIGSATSSLLSQSGALEKAVEDFLATLRAA
ncbi:methyl-accepting chemotaxis protein [Radicibacter daui]|uniref:methyl-accepting chemotaxis protein n=1 Tax=Radicibacter daui TaxID=3064829 RepID=UPI004046AE4C